MAASNRALPAFMEFAEARTALALGQSPAFTAFAAAAGAVRVARVEHSLLALASLHWWYLAAADVMDPPPASFTH